ncbi:hypothetical protein ACFQ07_08195, partial [Actinomadura adrarensis]
GTIKPAPADDPPGYTAHSQAAHAIVGALSVVGIEWDAVQPLSDGSLIHLNDGQRHSWVDVHWLDPDTHRTPHPQGGTS